MSNPIEISPEDCIQLQAFARFLQVAGPAPDGTHKIAVPEPWYSYGLGKITASEALELDKGTSLTSQYTAAVEYARTIHVGQIRKATRVPYLSHLLAVSGLVLEMGGNEDEAIAALLHDAIEDCGAHVRPVIKDMFGAKVLGLIEEVTETDIEPKPSWRERKGKYLTQLDCASDGALKIALADKLHNARCTLRAPRSSRWVIFNADEKSQRWWYDELLAVFNARILSHTLIPFVDELDDLVDAMFL